MKSPKTVQILNFMDDRCRFSHKNQLFWFLIVHIGKISLISPFNPIIILVYFSKDLKPKKLNHSPMTLREALGIVLLVVILQLCLGLLLYGPLRPVPSLELQSIFVAILMMAVVAGSIAAALAFIFKRYAGERAMRVAMMTLTEDERKVLELVLRSGDEVRQDKLRRELDFSKSKLSALVNNLERKRAITKNRHHKTNVLKVSKEFAGR